MKLIKNIKKNTIVLLLITIIVLYFVLRNDFDGIVKAFRNIDIKYILLALLLYITSLLIKAYINYLIINEKDKINLKESIKHNLITQFFNGITPFSTGGQPMEIYMIREHKISLAKATNSTMQSFIFYQIALVLCGIGAIIYNFTYKIFPKIKLLQNLVLFGFIINIAVVIVLLLVAYSRKITEILRKISIKVLRKFKKEISEESINKKFDEYYTGFQELKKNKKLTMYGIVLNIISLLLLYSIPLFILYSIGNFNSMNILDVITASAYVYLIGGFVPIPGASGGIEFGFNEFFGNFIIKGTLSATLLIWRFITYYLGMIVGAFLFSLENKEKNE